MSIAATEASTEPARHASKYRFFVAVSPGLESLLEHELRELGIESRSTPGGVDCTGPIEVLWNIHHHSRLAESVRLRLRPFKAKSFSELEDQLLRLPWHGYLRRGATYEVSVSCQESQLYHTDAVAERVRRVVDRRIGSLDAAVSTLPVGGAQQLPEDLAQKLQVRVHRNTVQVSVDASGGRLHRRGYRVHVGVAPLRETLAAATVRLLDRVSLGQPILRLWDPCCGSGTLLAEWLLFRGGAAVQPDRRFAFEYWSIHDQDAYAAWCKKQRQSNAPTERLQAFGSDSDPRCIDAARHNLTQANLGNECELICDDFSRAVAQIPPGTAVVGNLPYGVRLADRGHATRLFLKLDRLLSRRFDLRPVVVLTTFTPPKEARCDWKSLASFANGGLRVSAWGVAGPGATASPP